VQESILRAVQYFHTLRNESDARAWLLAIVRRECYTSWHQREGRRDTVSIDSSIGDEKLQRELVDPDESPEKAAERSFLRDLIADAVEKLPLHLKEVVILRELQQCSYDEIAGIIDAPIGTVMSRISRARTRLASSLREHVDLGELS
jgi:RNA polymerase sigma-70 factor (ECF subfamily)